jgi:hypothetical protein
MAMAVLYAQQLTGEWKYYSAISERIEPPLDVICPKCKAGVGKACFVVTYPVRWKKGKGPKTLWFSSKGPHKERIEESKVQEVVRRLERSDHDCQGVVIWKM